MDYTIRHKEPIRGCVGQHLYRTSGGWVVGNSPFHNPTLFSGYDKAEDEMLKLLAEDASLELIIEEQNV